MNRTRGPSSRAVSALAAGVLISAGTMIPFPGTTRAGMAGTQSTSAIRNIRVSHDRYLDHVEPSLAVNPRNPRNLLGAAQLIGLGSNVIGTFVSFDGGSIWHDNGPLPLPTGATFGDDVTVAFDAHGTGYVAAMMDRATAPNIAQNDRGVYVWRTIDGGRTFQSPVTAMRHQFADHPWLAVGTQAGASAVTPYIVWVTQDHGGLGFTRSTDGGRHFAAPRTVSTPAGGVSTPMAATGPSGAIYVTYLTARQGADPPPDEDAGVGRQEPDVSAASRTPAPGREDARVAVVVSLDQGGHFAKPTLLGSVSSQLQPAPGLSLTTGPSVAVDPRTNTVYVAYVADHLGTASTDVLLRRSLDHGRTWQAAIPVAVGATAGGAVYFQPQVVVDSAGDVDVSFFALAHGRVGVMLARSTTHGGSFGSPRQITAHPFDPSKATVGQGPTPKHGLWWLGDYQGFAVGPGMLYPFWNDTRTGHLEIFVATIPIAAFQ